MEQEKKVEEQKEEVKEEQASSATGEKEEEQKDDFDYKNEYEKLIEKKEKENFAWDKVKKENKELKARLKEKGEDEKEDETPDIRSIIKEEIGTLKGEILSDKLENDISKLTDNHYAKEMIKSYLGKYPGISLEEAWILTNKSRIEGQIAELKKSNSSKERKGDGAGAGQKAQTTTEPKLSSDNMTIVSRMGLKWDGKMFSKKDGKFGLKPSGDKLVQVRL